MIMSEILDPQTQQMYFVSQIEMNDSISDASSLDDSSFNDSNLLSNAITDDVTAQLASAGPVGVAAAAAISTGKKRKRPHSFEINPSIRRRQQTRLLRKLRATMDEYTTRVGQQAIILCCTPGKMQNPHYFRVFGSQPLEGVIRNQKVSILNDLEHMLAQQAPPKNPSNPMQHELPPLTVDGIPTPVDKMTQAQLRMFIPEMLKYSTGRSKPGWGKNEFRPPWWPADVPWANVRSDVRTEEQKKKVSWTHILQNIVQSCYQYHGRNDLIPDFRDKDDRGMRFWQTISNPDGTLSFIQVDTGEGNSPLQLVTLPDGTQAQILRAIPTQRDSSQTVEMLNDMANGQSIDFDVGQSVGQFTEAKIGEDGQLIFQSDGGMLTIPMYQQVVSSLAHLNDSTEDQQSTTIQVFASSLFTQVDGQLQLMTQNSDDKNVVDHEFSETVLDNENQSLDCSHELDDQR